MFFIQTQFFVDLSFHLFQGHSTKEQNITFKQRLKNAYIEYKYGMAYYNFPWNPKLMAGWVLTIVAICVITRYVSSSYSNFPSYFPLT